MALDLRHRLPFWGYICPRLTRHDRRRSPSTMPLYLVFVTSSNTSPPTHGTPSHSFALCRHCVACIVNLVSGHFTPFTASIGTSCISTHNKRSKRLSMRTDCFLGTSATMCLAKLAVVCVGGRTVIYVHTILEVKGGVAVDIKDTLSIDPLCVARRKMFATCSPCIARITP